MEIDNRIDTFEELLGKFDAVREQGNRISDASNKLAEEQNALSSECSQLKRENATTLQSDGEQEKWIAEADAASSSPLCQWQRSEQDDRSEQKNQPPTEPSETRDSGAKPDAQVIECIRHDPPQGDEDASPPRRSLLGAIYSHLKRAIGTLTAIIGKLWQKVASLFR